MKLIMDLYVNAKIIPYLHYLFQNVDVVNLS